MQWQQILNMCNWCARHSLSTLCVDFVPTADHWRTGGTERVGDLLGHLASTGWAGLSGAERGSHLHNHKSSPVWLSCFLHWAHQSLLDIYGVHNFFTSTKHWSLFIHFPLLVQWWFRIHFWELVMGFTFVQGCCARFLLPSSPDIIRCWFQRQMFLCGVVVSLGSLSIMFLSNKNIWMACWSITTANDDTDADC